MREENALYKVFHAIVPRGGVDQAQASRPAFLHTWDRFAVALTALAKERPDFRFYTRTPRTEPHNPAQAGSHACYRYEGVDVVAFDTLESATVFRDAASLVKIEAFDPRSTWLITKEHVAINGAPKGPLDTGRGVKVITSMKRRPGIGVLDFRVHWDDHVRYVAATQGISRFTKNHLVDAAYEALEPPVDGFVEVWFRTVEDMTACFRDPMMTGVQQTHNDLYIDRKTFFTIRSVDAEQWISGRRAEGLPEW